jgi:alkyl sulfatase BDS1-like metallo-beta-lactamase superfamily hydrolase
VIIDDLGAHPHCIAADLLQNVPAEQFLTAMAARLNGPRANGKSATINYIFTDLNESYVLTLENSVLHYRRAAPDPNADTTVRLTRPLLIRLALGQAGLRELVFSDDLSVEGSRLALVDFLRLFDTGDPNFPIVTP